MRQSVDFPDALNAIAAESLVMGYGGFFISGAWSMVMLKDIHSGIEMEDNGELDAPLSTVNSNNIEIFQQYVNGVDWNVVDISRFARIESKREI